MLSLPRIKTLYEFHYWARDQLLAGVTQVQAAQYTQPVAGGLGSIRDTLVHTVNAEEIWFARLKGQSPTSLADPAETPTPDALIQRWAASETAVRAYLNRLAADRLTQSTRYTNTKGEAFTGPVWQILLHVLNHATEHRAQVSTTLTGLGISHPAMDMIVYFRGQTRELP